MTDTPEAKKANRLAALAEQRARKKAEAAAAAAAKDADKRPSLDLDDGIELDRELLTVAKSIAFSGPAVVEGMAQLVDEIIALRAELAEVRRAVAERPVWPAPAAKRVSIPSGVS